MAIEERQDPARDGIGRIERIGHALPAAAVRLETAARAPPDRVHAIHLGAAAIAEERRVLLGEARRQVGFVRWFGGRR